ncbi:ADP-forming succinate--CoA ligase subunit beta [Fluviispira multicolorata]|uniref:Succinate--CoA ligase [ADP-forming] subunit beta n=1 Tax=Fluviispira multicolorata TaxID=2654512 RepID=A0A833JFG0_9BACT|nr:ADP-forming succinate--CoA ligase subunit beta [Fluviispira multicolorata]KAB8031015.1 ADP-forming succinate--CoA ligase subunit beta [Fluviispira multicolorata]
MNIHEYQAKELLSRFGLSIPRGKLACTPTEAEWAARKLGCGKDGKVAVVKAQIHSGGRGKAGGVKLVKSPEEAKEVAQKMLGITLVTNQTGPHGKKVSKLLVAEGCDIDKEYYIALVVNRETATIGVMASTEGGMDIEEVADKYPEKIVNANIDPTIGLQDFTIRKLSIALGFGLGTPLAKDFAKTLKGLVSAFLAYDCDMLEINPLVLTKQNTIAVLDCKMSFDENALFRHPEISDLRDFEEDDAKELEASKYGLSYVSLEGNIGCLVNGAGLAMATMDIIKQTGGQPANFLDVGGGANQETVTQAFRIILRDKAVKGIFVNIFGGIMKCDVIANGIVAAAKELGLRVPLVVRLEGTNVEIGKRILNDSGLNILSASSMGDGAQKIVQAVK